MAVDQTKSKTVRLYVVEEQEIYRDIYKYIFPSGAPVELLRVSANGDVEALMQAVSDLCPDVVLLSAKKLEINIIEELEQIRTDYPEIGIVLLLVFCSAQDIDLLRRLALKGQGGMALFLKQSLDQIEQLVGIIMAVDQGQVILDPPLAALMFTGKTGHSFLKQLTARELEVLSLRLQGYTNSAMAEVLYIDIKTVEHHLNSIYSKLRADSDFDDRHLRVSAMRLYLETMGQS